MFCCFFFSVVFFALFHLFFEVAVFSSVCLFVSFSRCLFFSFSWYPLSSICLFFSFSRYLFFLRFVCFFIFLRYLFFLLFVCLFAQGTFPHHSSSIHLNKRPDADTTDACSQITPFYYCLLTLLTFLTDHSSHISHYCLLTDHTLLLLLTLTLLTFLTDHRTHRSHY